MKRGLPLPPRPYKRRVFQDEFVSCLELFHSKYSSSLKSLDDRLNHFYETGNLQRYLQIINADQSSNDIIVAFFGDQGVDYGRSLCCMSLYVRPEIGRENSRDSSPSTIKAASIVKKNLRDFIEARKHLASDDIHTICATYGRLANINDIESAAPGQIFVQVRSRYSEYAERRHGLLFQIEAVSDISIKSTYYELNARDVMGESEFDWARIGSFMTVGEPLKMRDTNIPYAIFPVSASRRSFESRWSHLANNRELYILNNERIDALDLRACLTEVSKQTRFKRHGLLFSCNHVLYLMLMYLVKNRRLMKTCNLLPMPLT